MENAEWYVDWFNSPYYHLLYTNRNYTEANFLLITCVQIWILLHKLLFGILPAVRVVIPLL